MRWDKWDGYQYRSAASDDLSSSANMKNIKSGNDMPVWPKPPSLPSEKGLKPTWKILRMDGMGCDGVTRIKEDTHTHWWRIRWERRLAHRYTYTSKQFYAQGKRLLHVYVRCILILNAKEWLCSTRIHCTVGHCRTEQNTHITSHR